MLSTRDVKLCNLWDNFVKLCNILHGFSKFKKGLQHFCIVNPYFIW